MQENSSQEKHHKNKNFTLLLKANILTVNNIM